MRWVAKRKQRKRTCVYGEESQALRVVSGSWMTQEVMHACVNEAEKRPLQFLVCRCFCWGWWAGVWKLFETAEKKVHKCVSVLRIPGALSSVSNKGGGISKDSWPCIKFGKESGIWGRKCKRKGESKAWKGWDHGLTAPCSNYNILCLECVTVLCVRLTACTCISGPLKGILDAVHSLNYAFFFLFSSAMHVCVPL